jgi:hypothetical protein
MITKFKKFNESRKKFVGVHCSPKIFNENYNGVITHEYYNSFETILKLIQLDYKEAKKYLEQIESFDELNLENDSIELIFDIESFFADNYIEWIFVATEPLTKYGDNCYNVYFTDLSNVYSIEDELVDGATIYIYNSKNIKPILEITNYD